jgi:hypothetical protein
MESRRLREECLEIGSEFDLPPESRIIVSGQPADDPVHFLLRPSFLQSLLDVRRIDFCEWHREDAVSGQ